MTEQFIYNCWYNLCFLCVFRYGLGVTQEEMKQELNEYLPSLEHWAKEYLSTSTPKAFSLKGYRHLMLCSFWPTHIHIGEMIDLSLSLSL